MQQVDQVRDYWNARPCNIKHSPAAVGSLNWSREVTSRKYFVESHIPAFADFEKWRGKNVLEIGCGIGTDTLEFARAGAQILAMDLSLNSTRLAARRIYIEGLLEAAAFVCGDAESSIPLGIALYDLIYSFGVLHHTPHPETVLLRAHGVLKPDGELRIMLYSRWSLKYLLGQRPEAQAGCPIAKFYSKRETKDLLEGCGFRVTSIEKTHIFPWRLADYLQYRYVKLWPYRIMPPSWFGWLERHAGHHLLIKAVKA